MNNIKKEDFPTRLRQIMNERGLSQAELSKLTKITASSISDWLNYKYEAKQDKVDIIATALNISPSWLLGYDVPQVNYKTTKSTLTQSEQRLLNNYNSTTDKGKSRIMTTSEEMVELYPIIDRDEMLDYLIKNGIQEAALYGKNINDLSDEQLAFVYKSLREDEWQNKKLIL